MSNILSRIKKISEEEGISIRQLEQEIGASNGVINNALKRNTDISSKWLSKIIDSYPEYSPRWLLTGVGDMRVNYENSSLVKESKPPLPPLTKNKSLNNEEMQEIKDYYDNLCRTKDTTIETLQKLVENQSKMIEKLEREIEERTQNS